MPSTMSKPGKQLGQLLQEQQEPFILETYLLERGCLKKNLTSEGGFSCCHGNSSKLLKRSASCDLNMSGKGIPQCSKILRAIFNKLVSITGNPKSKLCDHDGGVLSFSEVGSSSQKVAEQDSFSSASTTTVFNSCSASDSEDSCASLQIHDPFSTATTIQALKQNKPREEEAATDRQVQGRSKNQRLQFGPISFLGDSSIGLSNAKTRKQENSSTRKSGFSNRVIQDSVSSASLLEVLVQSPTEKPRYSGVTELQELVWSNSSSRCFKSKRVLLQRKKLLFDCVREVVEGHGRNERREQSIGEFLGPEELEQLICQKIRAWERQSGKETNINHLLNFDFIASSQEWNDLRPESRELGLDFGEAILEEMMSEIVTDMMNII